MSFTKNARRPTCPKTFRMRLTRRKKRMPTRAGTGNVSVGRPRSDEAIGSGPHASEQNEPYDAERDARNPGRDLRRQESLRSEALGQVHCEEEDDGGAEADGDTVRGAAALVAGRERRSEQ